MRTPSGEQFELADGGTAAVVTEVGASLRHLEVDGRAVLWGYQADERASGGRGQVLAPWPNRLEAGRYRFGSSEGQAGLDDPDRGCAIHGLVRWVPWQVRARHVEAVTLGYELAHQPAYPFQITLEVTYRLEQAGIEVGCVARNEGTGPAPFGLGFHPFLDPGAGGLAAARLEIPAARELPLDERGLPCGPARPLAADSPLVAVAAAPAGAPVPIGDTVLDHCLTDLSAGPDGRWRIAFVPAPAAGEPARRVELWADAAFGYCQVFTADTLPGALYRRAIAVEPMTCPANALRSGDGLIVLEPGASFEASWGIRLLA